MKIELRSFKEAGMDDSLRFEAWLWCDGVKTAHVSDDGNGGCHMYHVENRAKFVEFEAFVKTQPPYVSDTFTMPADNDMVIDRLIDMAQNEKWLKSQCRTKGMFRTSDMPEGEYRTVLGKYDLTMKRWILERCPNAEIANERFTPVALDDPKIIEQVVTA